ncbi:hypothetical protein I8752_00630 [Nostocaceae cyanobacterium CENA369]|uniref:Uncharacterized protein n=1 Tax=Dendronalium phyllosphericum CENA369 TaxID=1725256 RepID=A0A8J7I128_9NOST|nr:hypothetical protein [Dendronalium phyllosphericum]MBH8571553.1 hypothetical protein [Dendronalium phyllosphericum CENA369]
MKQWLSAILLPIVLMQAPVFAQTKSPSAVNEQIPAKQVITPTPKPAVPNLVPLKGTEQMRLQLVNCGGWLDCALARLLLHPSAYIDRRELWFDNSTQVPVSILNTAIVVEGDFTGYQLNNQAIFLAEGIKTLPANQIVSIPLILKRSAIPPDRYSGAIYLTLQNRSDRFSLPVNLSVRSGPLLPLLVLFFGVILGRLFKYMQERGEPQAKALEEIYRLEADIASAKLEDRNKQLLADMVNEVRTLVVREQLDTVSTQVQTIRDRLETLVKLQALEDRLNEQATTFPTDVDEYTLKISKARQYIAQKEDAKAKELLEKISSDLDSVGARAGGDSGIEAYKRSLEEIVTATNRINQPIKEKITPSSLAKFQQFLINLSGVSDRVRAEATFWVVRPLLSLILLVGLSAAGISSLYIENGTTFGARPFADYLGLILWGLSADVASRSLSNLPGAKQ